MLFNRDNLEYRKSAQALVVRGDKVLITQEINWNDNEWGFPGGQIEGSETPEQAALRELHEEFPKNTFRILKQASKPLKYDWPDQLIEGDFKSKGWSYRGQIREQFLAEMNEADIIEAKQDELKAYKWVLITDLSDYLIFPNQLQSTLDILTEFGFSNN